MNKTKKDLLIGTVSALVGFTTALLISKNNKELNEVCDELSEDSQQELIRNLLKENELLQLEKNDLQIKLNVVLKDNKNNEETLKAIDKTVSTIIDENEKLRDENEKLRYVNTAFSHELKKRRILF